MNLLKPRLRDGGLVITRYKGLSVKVVVPEEIYDQPVIGIAKEAFASNKKITSVTVPGCVSKIEAGTFRDCPALKSVFLCTGVASIGEHAFAPTKDTFSVWFSWALDKAPSEMAALAKALRTEGPSKAEKAAAKFAYRLLSNLNEGEQRDESVQNVLLFLKKFSSSLNDMGKTARTPHQRALYLSWIESVCSA